MTWRKKTFRSHRQNTVALLKVAEHQETAIMNVEELWWSLYRSLI